MDKNYIILLVIAVLIIIVSITVAITIWRRKFPSREVNQALYNNPMVVERFHKLKIIWYSIFKDDEFKNLAHDLMDINSGIPAEESNKGNLKLYHAFNKLDDYVKHKMKWLHHVRITLIYTDGILFYDSVVPMEKIYFMDKNLPKPVSLYTLGSPLKDHNTLPEVTSSVVVSDSKHVLLAGMDLKAPIYRELLGEGFGFYERMSSSLNRPFTYLAKFMVLDNEKYHDKGFVDGCTLRVGFDIANNEPIEEGDW